MDSINKLVEIFSEFPGIGPRQAKRFAYFLISQKHNFIRDFIDALSKIKEEVGICSSCFRFFPKKKSDARECSTCTEKNRDVSSIMIVSRDSDFESIEKTGLFNGKYLILGGTVPILEKEPEKRIRIKELIIAIEKRAKEGLKEIIIAMNMNPDGENTEEYLRKIITPIAENLGIKISVLGRGLSTGTELEYSDSETIKNALKNRQ